MPTTSEKEQGRAAEAEQRTEAVERLVQLYEAARWRKELGARKCQEKDSKK